MRPAGFALASLLLTLVTGACGGANNDVPEALEREALALATVAPPDRWEPFETIQRTDDQFERDIDGVTVVYAGDFRDLDDVSAASAGVAWRSPVLTSGADRAAACRAAADLVARAGAVTALDEQACIASPDDPNLRVDFVLAFWSEAVVVPAAVRTYGGGVHLDDTGGVRVVISLASALPSP